VTRDEDVRERLAEVFPPGEKQNILDGGYVREFAVRNEGVEVVLRLREMPAPGVRAVVADIRRAVGALPGIDHVEVRVDEPRAGGSDDSIGWVPGGARVIAVSSAKGGVGKSTVAINLACALRGAGNRVGLLDADVYGPSVPTMLGIAARPTVAEGSKIPAIEKHGLKVMSIGFFLDDRSPIIWRGPLVTGLLRQFVKDVDWGELDFLVVDMPPGTGDAQLTLAQQVPMAGAVVVTTPQRVSLADVKRGIAMFVQVGTPVLGVVENMSGYECPQCGTRDDLFGVGGTEGMAREMGLPVLGSIPLLPEIRRSGDGGCPLVEAQPDHAVSRVYARVAGRVLEAVRAATSDPVTPRIVG